MKIRRHRFTEEEIPKVTHGLILRLKQLSEKREQLEQSQIIMKCLERLITPKPGKPRGTYWDLVDYYASNVKANLPELLERA